MLPATAAPFNAVLRLAIGASLGLALAKLSGNDNWGVFYTIVPVLLLGLLPTLNLQLLQQFVAANVVAAGMLLLSQLLTGYGAALSLLVLLFYFWLFRLMAKGQFFVFAAVATINASIFLHFASYPATDPAQLLGNSAVAMLAGILIALTLSYLLPTPPPAGRPALPDIPVSHSALHAMLATASFLAFQWLDLKDSLSAQASTILILLPLQYQLIVQAGLKRARGVLLGSAYAIGCQVLLFSHYQQLALVLPLFFLGMLIFANAQLKEGPGSGVAFGAMTTMAIIFGQYLTPQQDLMYSALYRISSVTVAVGATLALATLGFYLLTRQRVNKQ